MMQRILFIRAESQRRDVLLPSLHGLNDYAFEVP